MKCTRRNLRVSICSFLAFLLALFVVTSCSAQEKEYLITGTQLTKWQAELNLQQAIITKQRQNEERLKKELALLRSDLKLSREALTRQEVYLSSTKKALTDANESLTKLSKEIKARERRLKWQRNFAYVLAAGLAYKLAK